MKYNTYSEGKTLNVAVVDSGLGSKVLKEASKVGVTGGTIFLGRGTVRSHILELLGLDRIKKEIVFMIAKGELENSIHHVLSKKFNMHKANHGIVFSSPLKKAFGVNSSKVNNGSVLGGNEKMEHEAIFTIVERGLGRKVVEAATNAGARGATIINARGSGIHEQETFFSMNIEPEKEIVMIIIEKKQSEAVMDSINKSLKIQEPGMGIMFVMDISKVSGLYTG